MRWLTRAYLTIDPRSLAAGRIALGLVLLLDLARRVSVLGLWYSNQGLMPNHTVLWQPPFPHTFSFFFMASLPDEAALGFGLCAVAYLMLLVGNRTKLAHLASLVALLSLHGRTLFVQNGGDVALVELCVWTLFLPTGRRYSIDCLRERLEAPAKTAAEARASGDAVPPDASPVVSLAVLAVVAQLAVIYFFNALQKNGSTWRGGSAVHYMLHSDGLVTGLGLWVRGWLTPGQSRALTWSALAIEGALPVVLLAPVVQRYTRRLAIALILGLHVGIGLFFNLGVFVPVMIAFTPLLIAAADWDALERWWATRAGREAGRRSVLDLSLKHGLQYLARQGLASSGGTHSMDAPPWKKALQAMGPLLRESTVALLMICAMVRTLGDNRAVTHVDPSREPRVIEVATTYLQMLQAWLLFAPDAPTTDATISVDAVTADNRHVDPLNAIASANHTWLGGEIPPRLGYDAFTNAYVLRLPFWPAYFNAFGEWILRYPDRTGRAEDRIVSFQVLVVEDDSPPPGERSPRNARTRLLFKYPD